MNGLVTQNHSVSTFLCTYLFISHSFNIYFLMLTVCRCLFWLLWTPSKTSHYPYLRGMKSSVIRAATGWGQLGACVKAGGGPSPALGMREAFPE